MQLTPEQVDDLAPDSSSAAAGRKLMALKNWQELGRSKAALWGKCQGSRVYQVKVDLMNLGYNCNCPSRKFPCKHVLGLLMLTASSPAAVAATTAPDWVEDWLSKRQTRQAQKAARTDEPRSIVDEQAQQKRVAKREARVNDGVARLDLWLKDLVRGGLAGVESKAHSFWDEQVRRLVDAQAPGLASRVARLADIPGSSREWPARLLAEAGRLKLLIQAWQRISELDPDLQNDIRQLIGWSISQEDLLSSGERVTDTWCLYGQWVDDDGRVKAQRTWAVGRASGRTALLLQFSAGGQTFAEPVVAGSQQPGTLTFYPGAARQRAQFVEHNGELASFSDRLPGHGQIGDFLAAVSGDLSRQPWLTAHGCVLRDVTLVPEEETWYVRDCAGNGLPLSGRDHWNALAMTGGAPFDLTGEWDGHRLRVLGLVMDGEFHTP